MNDESNHDRERQIGNKIANSIRAIDQGPKKQVTDEELERLKAAAGRLDQMLNAAKDADRQSMKHAAERLDQLLADIRKGKDVTLRLKRQRRETTE